MVASRMVVYRESSKEAEYATVEHIRVLYVSLVKYFSSPLSSLDTRVGVLHRAHAH